jgi:hypothetical protein
LGWGFPAVAREMRIGSLIVILAGLGAWIPDSWPCQTSLAQRRPPKVALSPRLDWL